MLLEAHGDVARARLRAEVLIAPDVVDLEVVSAWRRLEAAGHLDARRVALALKDLHDLPVRRVPHQPFVERCWELRGNVAPYDAVYVAIAEVFDATLVTTDGRLARAPGPTCA